MNCLQGQTIHKKGLPLFLPENDDDDEFRFNDASTHEGHLRQNGKLTWFCNETAIKVSYSSWKKKIKKPSAVVVISALRFTVKD